MRTKLFYFIFILSFLSCEKRGDLASLQIYKTKADYTNKVSLWLSDNRTHIEAFPGPMDVDTMGDWPKQLANGYWLGDIFGGSKAAFLSIDKKEYSKWPNNMSMDTLYDLIIDKDPFTEFYYYYDEKGNFRNDHGIDTMKINQLIRDGKLEDYFERIK